MSPGFGPQAGGTTVTIIGSGFSGSPAVEFGSTPATGVVINSATSITATSPAGSGIVDVTVTKSLDKSSISSYDDFAYLSDPTSYTVTDGSDTNGSASDVTLRYAIDQAVANNEDATIGFAPSLADTTIMLSQDEEDWLERIRQDGVCGRRCGDHHRRRAAARGW